MPVGQRGHARAGGRAAALGGRALDHARDVLAGDPVLARGQQPQLAAVEREGADGDQRLVGRGLGDGHVLELDPPGTVGRGDGGLHAHAPQETKPAPRDQEPRRLDLADEVEPLPRCAACAGLRDERDD
nr:hypothetical protein [Candidatus Solirubrobacter pratensis]